MCKIGNAKCGGNLSEDLRSGLSVLVSESKAMVWGFVLFLLVLEDRCHC